MHVRRHQGRVSGESTTVTNVYSTHCELHWELDSSHELFGLCFCHIQRLIALPHRKFVVAGPGPGSCLSLPALVRSRNASCSSRHCSSCVIVSIISTAHKSSVSTRSGQCAQSLCCGPSVSVSASVSERQDKAKKKHCKQETIKQSIQHCKRSNPPHVSSPSI